MANPSYYETDRGAAEYLLLHYGDGEEFLPPDLGVAPRNFPARCVSECFDGCNLPPGARALDLGCAVGRSSFELAARCAEVVAIDKSKTFISIARYLQHHGACNFEVAEEGDLSRKARAIVPPHLDRTRVRFGVGDATHLPRNLGQFDAILMANLIDRLNDPSKCLQQLPKLVRPGGWLAIASPYTWLAEYTPRNNWLGGFRHKGRAVRTINSLKTILSPTFKLAAWRDLPFVIREHARKFQLGIAQATVWSRRYS